MDLQPGADIFFSPPAPIRVRIRTRKVPALDAPPDGRVAEVRHMPHLFCAYEPVAVGPYREVVVRGQ